MSNPRKYDAKTRSQACQMSFKATQKSLTIHWRKDEYYNFILPAIEKSDKTITPFIKEAIYEKIVRDGLDVGLGGVKE